MQLRLIRPSLLLSQPAVPLVAFAAIAFASTGLSTTGTDWQLVLLAEGFTAVVTAAALLIPWRRLPALAVLILPVSCDLVIALLRHAQGGSTSGYAPLAMLPVVWVGLTLSRVATAAIIACTAATLAVPIVTFGRPMYPETAWRGVVLWVIVSAVVGIAANLVVASQRRHAVLARGRARRLRRLVETQNTIAHAELDLNEVIAVVEREARDLTGAAGVVVEVAGGIDPTLSAESIRRRTTLISDDSETDPRVDRDACRRAGIRSLVVVPLFLDGRPTGVLKIHSPAPNAFSAEAAQVLTALANLVGGALARAEWLARLHERSVTDELTGLRNRRGWYDELGLALERARCSGQPVSVIALEVDGLREVNDKGGHAAGDRLLVEVASRWPSVLRPADILARIGGDEFAAVLEGADEALAAGIAMRLSDAVPGGGTTSTGISTWDGEQQPAELMRRAHADLSQRKTAGSQRRSGVSPVQ
jgi:diguanylate cyclase (GGDEF)-like protein